MSAPTRRVFPTNVDLDELIVDLDLEGPTTDETQQRCFGEGIASSLGSQGLTAIFRTGSLSPDQIAAVQRVLARCAPDIVAALVAKSIVNGGAPSGTARCMAERIVNDGAALDEWLSAAAKGGFEGGAVPPRIAEAVAVCR